MTESFQGVYCCDRCGVEEKVVGRNTSKTGDYPNWHFPLPEDWRRLDLGDFLQKGTPGLRLACKRCVGEIEAFILARGEGGA